MVRNRINRSKELSVAKIVSMQLTTGEIEINRIEVIIKKKPESFKARIIIVTLPS